MPSVHQKPDLFFPPYIKIIYQNQIFFLTRSCSHLFNTLRFYCPPTELPSKQYKPRHADTIPDAKLAGCPKTGGLWPRSPLDYVLAWPLTCCVALSTCFSAHLCTFPSFTFNLHPEELGISVLQELGFRKWKFLPCF